VTLGEGIYVEVSERFFVFIDFKRRDFAGGYGAEYAIVFHAAIISDTKREGEIFSCFWWGVVS
jgi:hypothetical protein